jgi:hypothetical protein
MGRLLRQPCGLQPLPQGAGPPDGIRLPQRLLGFHGCYSTCARGLGLILCGREFGLSVREWLAHRPARAALLQQQPPGRHVLRAPRPPPRGGPPAQAVPARRPPLPRHVPPCLVNAPPPSYPIEIRRGWASAAFGSVSVSTPSLSCALIVP